MTQISETIAPHMLHGRMTLGYAVKDLAGETLYVGTWGECVDWANKHLRAEQDRWDWVIEDARGLVVSCDD